MPTVQTFVQPDSLGLGIEVDLEDRLPVPALYVRWMAWDSGFRGSGLRVGDRIVALDGARLDLPKLRALNDQIRMNDQDRWKKAGASDKTPVILTVRRRVVPGHGWTEVDVRGCVRSKVTYQDEQAQIYVGPGGPAEWTQDGFSENWSGWYGHAVELWSSVLGDPLLTRSAPASDADLATLLESEDRVRSLEQHYPGPFAAAVREDFDAAAACLRGRPCELAPDALRYRERGQNLIDAIAADGTAARAAFLAAHAAELLPTLPTVNPILDDHRGVTGKLVELPVATNQEWISQGPRTYFVFDGGNDDWFFADAESRGAQAMLLARERYRQRASPNVRAEFRFVGSIQAAPALIRVGDQGHFGLVVEPVACTVGDAFFVDTTPARGDAPTFAGEERTHDAGAAAPPDAASPADVVGAFYAALKAGAQDLWASLYTPYSLWFLDDGTPRVNGSTAGDREPTWENARRKILDEVCDVRVVWTDDPLVLCSSTTFPGAPRIDQVVVEVEHVRRVLG